MRRYLALPVLLGIFGVLGSVAQTSHREPNPKPREQPNIFDQMEKQTTESPKEKASRAAAAAREQRLARLADLGRELPRVIELAETSQKRLNETDLGATVPADLGQQARELERVAHQIHKRIRSL